MVVPWTKLRTTKGKCSIADRASACLVTTKILPVGTRWKILWVYAVRVNTNPIILHGVHLIEEIDGNVLTAHIAGHVNLN